MNRIELNYPKVKAIEILSISRGIPRKKHRYFFFFLIYGEILQYDREHMDTTRD